MTVVLVLALLVLVHGFRIVGYVCHSSHVRVTVSVAYFHLLTLVIDKVVNRRPQSPKAGWTCPRR